MRALLTLGIGLLAVALLAACAQPASSPVVSASTSIPATLAVEPAAAPTPSPSVILDPGALTAATTEIPPAPAAEPPADATPSPPPPLDPATLDVTAANPLDEGDAESRGSSWGPRGYIVQLQAHNGQYVVADGDGRVRANRNTPLQWETFYLIDFNGSRLWHNDWVALVAHNGLLTADWPNNFGRTRWDLGFWIFQIKTCCGKAGEVVNGDRIHLAAAFSHWYKNQNDQWKWGTPFMSAVNGGGGDVNYNREWPNIETWDWLIFRIWNAGGRATSIDLKALAQSYDLMTSFQKGDSTLKQGGWLTATSPLTQVSPLANNANP